MTCVILLALRHPTSTEDTPLSDFKNLAGLSWQTMYDMQKLWACLDVSMKKKDNSKVLDLTYLSTVGLASVYSPTVNTMVQSQPEWRPACGVIQL